MTLKLSYNGFSWKTFIFKNAVILYLSISTASVPHILAMYLI